MTTDVAETTTEEAEVETPESTVDKKPLRSPILLLAMAVLLAGAGIWLTVAAHGLRSAPSTRNRALLDAAATAQVNSSITTALNRIFSYSYDRTEATEQAAKEVLRGSALDTYHQLFAQVRALAPQQKLVLTTRVVSSAVQYLSGDDARLLVFLDQSATRVDNNSTSAAAAQLSVNAKREGGTWIITDLTPR